MEFAINYGLIVVNPEQKGDELDILHFCGFEKEPTIDDANNLRNELRDDPSFELQNIWDKVDILPAPENIVEEYRKIINTPQE
ncbi:MAG: hypothetical protein PHF86_01785 [Candidatus Nanoarchaeia archaeon]|nr:hypothetical protein [Candidatus Nanoarchaeia archaeon]